MSASVLGYNSNDPLQVAFLNALGLGETGNSTFSATEGVGGSNLAGDPVDQYGFPQWQGQGNSHAAGTFQFQPSTWDSIASQFGLNFSNPADQQAGAWILAQQTYAANNGGASLETALQNGQFSSIQSALASVWPSVTGNQASPTGLAGTLSGVAGSNGGTLATTSGAIGASGGTSSGASGGTGGTGVLGTIGSFFVRGGLILVGGLVIVVALWMLLANQGYAPSPAKVAKMAVAI